MCTPSSLAPVLVLALASAASAQSVVMAQVEGADLDETLVAQVEAGLRSETRKVLGIRLLPVAPQRLSGCEAEGPCASRLAVEEGAQLALLASLQQTGEEQRLVARLFDAEGRLLAELERRGGGLLDGATLKGVALQLFEPDAYTGSVTLRDVPTGAQVLVDGIPLAPEELGGPLSLSVGEHSVDVTVAGRARETRQIDVRFGADTSLSLSLAGPEPAAPGSGLAGAPRGRPALWPGLVAAGVAGGAAVAGAVFASDYLLTRRRDKVGVDYQLAALEPRAGPDSHYVARELVPTARGLAPQRAALAIDALGLVASAVVLCAAGASAAALLTDWALKAEPSEEEP